MKEYTKEEAKRIKEYFSKVAEHEAMKLFRLARKAQEHGVKIEIIHEIMEEANYLLTTCTTYPGRLFDSIFKYAFK